MKGTFSRSSQRGGVPCWSLKTSATRPGRAPEIPAVRARLAQILARPPGAENVRAGQGTEGTHVLHKRDSGEPGTQHSLRGRVDLA